MAKGHALLVGLKSVDPTKYGGWDGANGCWGCESDVDNMERILKPLGFQITCLKTAQATSAQVLQALRESAALLKSGDLFVFYYSGHGGQQPDFLSATKDELDGKDETLLAYDREIIDDELNEIWLSLAKGVRVVMISDSCNSGTNYKNIADFDNPTPFDPVMDESTGDKMQAQMIHFGGCRDGFTSSGYMGGGAFTMALCNVWDNGKFKGNYRQLLDKAASLVATGQAPQYNEYGPVEASFRDSKPFQL
jgi:hypothetical protein